MSLCSDMYLPCSAASYSVWTIFHLRFCENLTVAEDGCLHSVWRLTGIHRKRIFIISGESFWHLHRISDTDSLTEFMQDVIFCLIKWSLFSHLSWEPEYAFCLISVMLYDGQLLPVCVILTHWCRWTKESVWRPPGDSELHCQRRVRSGTRPVWQRQRGKKRERY